MDKSDKIKILFACQWGMSSSLLAEKIQSLGKKQGLHIEIECLAADAALALDIYDYNLILIGPQVRFYKNKFEEREKELGLNIPIFLVDGMIYAMADGEALLKLILPEIKKPNGKTSNQ